MDARLEHIIIYSLIAYGLEHWQQYTNFRKLPQPVAVEVKEQFEPFET